MVCVEQVGGGKERCLFAASACSVDVRYQFTDVWLGLALLWRRGLCSPVAEGSTDRVSRLR
jgi:hypothetical protein